MPSIRGVRQGEYFSLSVTTASAQCLRLSERFFVDFCSNSDDVQLALWLRLVSIIEGKANFWRHLKQFNG